MPYEHKSRARVRVMQISYPSKGSEFSYFLLEHFYSARFRKAMFLVRSMDEDTKLKYTIRLYADGNKQMGVKFYGTTLGINDFRIEDYPDTDLKMLFQVDYRLLDSFIYYHENEGNYFFKFDVKFKIPAP
jgi:hypothetical protein